MSTSQQLMALLACGMLYWVACGNDSNPVDSDTVPPSSVTDLDITQFTGATATLVWTAPGDDGNSGRASEYDIRFSNAPINLMNWVAADSCIAEPTPGTSGRMETFTVTGLSSSTIYYFGLKVADEVPNWSGLSNIAQGSTVDSEPPSTITDLATANATGHSIDLFWTAPGDDGNSGIATSYDIRYSMTPITTINWQTSTQLLSPPDPVASGATQTSVVTDLNPSTVYFFAIKTSDEIPNWSGLSNIATDTTSINGNYTGLYSYAEITNGVDTMIDTSQLVEFRFRRGDYSMVLEYNIAESLRVFCDVLGEYQTVPGGLALEITDSNFTRGVCTQYWGPGGSFDLAWIGDSVILVSDSTDAQDSRFIRMLRLLADQ